MFYPAYGPGRVLREVRFPRGVRHRQFHYQGRVLGELLRQAGGGAGPGLRRHGAYRREKFAGEGAREVPGFEVSRFFEQGGVPEQQLDEAALDGGHVRGGRLGARGGGPGPRRAGFLKFLVHRRFFHAEAGGQRLYPFALHDLVGLLGHGLQHGRNGLGLLLRGGGRGPVLEKKVHAEFQRVGGRSHLFLELLPAVFVQEFVGVQRAAEVRQAHVQARVHENFRGPHRGGYAGAVAVEHHHGVLGVAAYEAGVLAGQRRAQRGHGPVHAVLVRAYHVHVAFQQQQAAALAYLRQGLVDAVKGAALREQDGFRGVQVFRLRFGVQHAPAESHGVAGLVADGEHDAAAESVGHPVAFALGDQPGLQGQVAAPAVRLHLLYQGAAARRGPTQLEALHGGLAQPALAKVQPGFLAGGGKKSFVVEGRGRGE